MIRLIRLLAATAIMLRAATCFIVSPLPALRSGAWGGTLHSKGRRSSPSCGEQVSGNLQLARWYVLYTAP